MEKILIIDDDKLIRMMLKKPLLKEGYMVIEAEDGERGLELVRKMTEQEVGANETHKKLIIESSV